MAVKMGSKYMIIMYLLPILTAILMVILIQKQLYSVDLNPPKEDFYYFNPYYITVLKE